MKSRRSDLLAAIIGITIIGAVSLGISGGPNYGGVASVTGVFAGVLSPQSCSATPAPSATPTTGRCGANSIGIFSLTVPKSGSATGPLVIFLEGQTYTGTITGTADPTKGSVSGLVSASFPYLATVVSGTEDITEQTNNGPKTTHKVNYSTQTFSASASGQVNAKINSKSSRFGTTSLRLKGTADVQFNLTVNNPFDEINYDVFGFKQADTATSGIPGT